MDYSSLWPDQILLIVLGAWVGLLVGFIISKLFLTADVRKERKSAVRQSKSVTMGFVTEAMAPMFPNFPYHHKDLMFMGKWVDYIVFDGMHEWDIKQIVFVEIKTWKSRLNANEKRIQKTIDARKVKYEVWRV